MAFAAHVGAFAQHQQHHVSSFGRLHRGRNVCGRFVADGAASDVNDGKSRCSAEISAKEAACGCAGCYTAHAGIELYAEAFEAAGALDRLEGFASFNGPDFYRLPRNTDTLTLVRDAWSVPPTLDYLADDPLVPLRAGEQIAWRLA